MKDENLPVRFYWSVVVVTLIWMLFLYWFTTAYNVPLGSLSVRGKSPDGPCDRDLWISGKARGGGDAVASSTTTNAARGRQLSPVALRVAGSRASADQWTQARLQCCGSLVMRRHRLVAAPRIRTRGARNTAYQDF